jgi:DNA-directed RNA polymerase subunit RPC12/RpoP
MCYRPGMAEDAPIHPSDLPPPPDDAPLDEAAPPQAYVCPQCDQAVELDPNSTEAFLQCPHCGGQFAVIVDEPPEGAGDDPHADQRAREAELDGMRIRQLSNARRALIRLRTYLFIGCVLGAVGGVQLIIKAVQRVRHEGLWDLRTVGFIAFAAACFMVAVFFLNRMTQMSHELKRPLLEEPTTPPDFSMLSDGSQHARDLEDIR